MRKSDTVDSENDKVYGLYAIRELRENNYLGIYMVVLVDYDANAKEEYLCNILKADSYKACMGMNYIKNPMFRAYAIKYNDNKTRMRVMGALKKKSEKKVNVKIMKDYLAIATKIIVAGDEIVTFCD